VRFLHQELSELLVQYLVFIRKTEEVFSHFLWGEDARTLVHYHLFYGHEGTVATTSHLSITLQRITHTYLQASLDVPAYRHMAAAIGRHLMVGIIDPEEEDSTTGMDAQAGRLTTTSERIYGLQVNEMGGLNNRVLALFRTTSNLWHSKVLGLHVKGHVADSILNLKAPTIGEAPVSSHPLSTLKTLLSEVIEEQIIPRLSDMLDQKLAGRSKGKCREFPQVSSFFSYCSLQMSCCNRTMTMGGIM
jgi:hypothetical protein